MGTTRKNRLTHPTPTRRPRMVVHPMRLNTTQNLHERPRRNRTPMQGVWRKNRQRRKTRTRKKRRQPKHQKNPTTTRSRRTRRNPKKPRKNHLQRRKTPTRQGINRNQERTGKGSSRAQKILMRQWLK